MASEDRNASDDTQETIECVPLQGSENQSLAFRLNATPGDYWCYLVNGRAWPIVIIEKDMVPSIFLENLPEGCVFPALVLGTNDIIWAHIEELLEWVPSTLPELALDGAPKGLIEAYVLSLQGHDLSYWRGIIESVWGSGRINGQSSAKKRESSPSLSFDQPLAKKLLRVIEVGSNNEVSGPSYSRSTNKGKKPLLPASSPRRTILSSRLDEHSHAEPWFAPKLDEERRSAETDQHQAEGSEVDTELVTVYTGREREPVRFSISLVPECRELGEEIRWVPGVGYNIDRPFFHRFSARDLNCALDWLSQKHENPLSAIKEGSLDGCLEDLNDEARIREVQRCGAKFFIGRELSLPGFMHFVTRELRLMRPWPALSILVTARWVFMHEPMGHSADDAMRSLLVQHIADNFYDLAADEPNMFRRVMRECPDLEIGVMEWRLAIAKEKRQQRLMRD